MPKRIKNEAGPNENKISTEINEPKKDKSIEEILEFCLIPRDREEIMRFIGKKTQHYVMKNIIQPLVDEGLLKLTLPDTPKSKNQKFFNARKMENR